VDLFSLGLVESREVSGSHGNHPGVSLRHDRVAASFGIKQI
jgi:hypothetical protein